MVQFGFHWRMVVECYVGVQNLFLKNSKFLGFTMFSLKSTSSCTNFVLHLIYRTLQNDR